VSGALARAKKAARAKLFAAAPPFVFFRLKFQGRGAAMTEKFSIPAEQAQAYSLMRTYDIAEEDLAGYISNMLGEIKVLAEYAKLPGVAAHIKDALRELEVAKSPAA
jgi:hypothetical protein